MVLNQNYQACSTLDEECGDVIELNGIDGWIQDEAAASASIYEKTTQPSSFTVKRSKSVYSKFWNVFVVSAAMLLGFLFGHFSTLPTIKDCIIKHSALLTSNFEYRSPNYIDAERIRTNAHHLSSRGPSLPGSRSDLELALELVENFTHLNFAVKLVNYTTLISVANVQKPNYMTITNGTFIEFSSLKYVPNQNGFNAYSPKGDVEVS